MSEQIIWTAVPKSAVGNSITVSAHVSFHLGGPGTTVSQYPNANGWNPAALTFTVYFQTATTSPKIKLYSGPPVPGAKAGVWQQLFPANGPVVPNQGQTDPNRGIQTFSTRAMGTYLLGVHAVNTLAAFEPPATAKQLYANPAIKGADIFFNASAVTDVLGGRKKPTASEMSAMQMAVAAQQDASILKSRSSGVVPTDPQTLLYEAWRFFQPYQKPILPPNPINNPKTVPPKVDFHQALAMVGQHSALMRLAGVVFDLTFPLPVGVPTGSGLISLEVSGMIPGATVQYPLTSVTLGPGLFQANPNPSGSPINQGYLDMSKTDVYEFDVDGGTQRMLDFASTMRQSVVFSSRKTDTTGQPLPSQKNGGIGVMMVNRQAVTVASRKRSESIRGAFSTTPLYADDLFKGWRPDIFHTTWYSLTARISDFYYGASFTELPGVQDETQISSALTSPPSGGDQRQHENLFTWEGWSLAVGKPGLPSDDTNGGQPSTSLQYTNFTEWMKQPGSTDAFYKLALNPSVPPKSLPMLRYGQWYGVRARSVDLAGNSKGLADPMDPKLTNSVKAIPYLRYDPIPSPTLHPIVPDPANPTLTPGNSPHVMVVHKYVDPTHNDLSETRWIVPPVGGISFAELHGKLDGALDPSQIDAIYALITAPDSIPALKVTVGANPPAIPYLPDPTADGATLIVPNQAGGNLLPTFVPGSYYTSEKWPKPGNLFLQIAPGNALTHSFSQGKFSVTLEPGRDITCGLSSNTTIQWLVQFAPVWYLEAILEAAGKSLVPAIESLQATATQSLKRMTEHPHIEILKKIPMPKQGTAAEKLAAEIVKLLLEGANTTITPRKEVRLIHACQIPEDVPGSKFYNSLTFTRVENSTQAVTVLDANVHNWSTGEVEIQAETVDLHGAAGEDVDYIAEPIRTTLKIDRKQVVLDQKITADPRVPVTKLAVQIPYEFHDTKCHFLKCVTIAKTRFRDYFPANMPPGTPFTRDYPYTNTATGDICVVPASKRPDPLDLEYIVPSFLWADYEKNGISLSGRKGNNLRIYLRRPWFSSGTAEMLGVVLLSDSTYLQPDVETFASQHHTMIGGDPVFYTLGEEGKPFNAQFPTSGPAVIRVKLAEDPSMTATVLPYEPQFDVDRQMWYVDLDIEPGSVYTPFVRLVLARFQPFALTSPDDLRLSPLVVADITQLQPDRIAVLQKSGNKVTVVLGGIPAITAYGANKVYGFLQMQATEDPDGGWVDVIDPVAGLVWAEIPFVNTLTPFATPVKVSTPAKPSTPAEPTKKSSSNHLNYLKNQATMVERPFAETQGLDQTIRTIDLANMPQVTPPTPTIGVFTIPTGSKPYRIVIREYEIHGGITITALLLREIPTGARLVHVDVVNVPG